jgi:glycosyltransferase involved in cell wall biosynthesis
LRAIAGIAGVGIAPAAGIGAGVAIRRQFRVACRCRILAAGSLKGCAVMNGMTGEAATRRMRAARRRISVVVPLYNEQEVVREFHARLSAVLDALPGFDCDVVYVNDGSSDGSLGVLHALQRDDARVGIVDLSRNFGKEIALTAGLDHAGGDAIVLIDCDLQDPPELIPELVGAWQQGYDVAYAQRTARDGETWLKRKTAAAFYRLIGKATDIELPREAGDFRLLSRRAADAVRSLREQHRYMKGLYAWVGFPQVAVPYRRAPRAAGTTKWSYWRLWNLAVEGFTSFTIAPLRLASWLGALVALCAFLAGAWVIYKTLVFGDPVRGYPSMMVVMLFLGGVQLLCLGVIGEYLGRMFNETKRRPLYFVNTVVPARATTTALPTSLRERAKA